MIGNDIVDLRLAATQSNWKRKGWLQKIFTDREQEYIGTSKNPEITVWKFWSMKEATYKAHQRRFLLPRLYNPKSFECTGQEVKIDTYTYSLVSEINQEYLYSIAQVITNKNKSHYGQILKANNSKLALNLKKTLASGLTTRLSEVSVIKEAYGIPWIYIKENKLCTPFSITHHGRFSAFVIGE